MNKKNTILLMAGIFAIAFIFNCCKNMSSLDDKKGVFHHSALIDDIKAKSIDSIQYDVSSASALQQFKTVLAQIHDTVAVFLPERTSMIKSYPCSNCHTKSVEQLKLESKSELRNAHWDIQLLHGNDEVMNCLTCHRNDNVNELTSLTGKIIAMAESFRQCSQCHSTQYKDWVGGSHGKRLGGWSPPRIIQTCVGCHNPHKPAFETRLPVWHNTVMESKTKSTKK